MTAPRLLKPTPGPNAGFYSDVMICCIPLLAVSYYLYGPRPLFMALVAVAVAYLCDRLLAPLHPADYKLNELSSECFALQLALLMPATVSYYVLIISVLVALLIGKEIFGGIGNYPFHPTAVGYAVAVVSWPSEVLRYPAIGQSLPAFGDVSTVPLFESASATLRSGGLPTTSVLNLLIGNYMGPLGTGCSLVIFACAAYLIIRKRVHLSTVLSFFVAAFLVVWILPRAGDMPHRSLPWTYVDARLTTLRYEMLSGALPFAAVFMLSEPVTAPRNHAGRILYGFTVGAAAMLFRYYGAYETGVSFALLAVNATSGWMDLLTNWIYRPKKKRKRAPAVQPVPAPRPDTQQTAAAVPLRPAAPARPAAAQPEPRRVPPPETEEMDPAVAENTEETMEIAALTGNEVNRTLLIPALRPNAAQSARKEKR